MTLHIHIGMCDSHSFAFLVCIYARYITVLDNDISIYAFTGLMNCYVILHLNPTLNFVHCWRKELWRRVETDLSLMTYMGHKRNCRIQMSLHEVEAKNQTEPYVKSPNHWGHKKEGKIKWSQFWTKVGWINIVRALRNYMFSKISAGFVEREKMTHNKVEPRYFSLLFFWLGEDNKKKMSIGLLRKNINSSLGYLPRDEVTFLYTWDVLHQIHLYSSDWLGLVLSVWFWRYWNGLR